MPGNGGTMTSCGFIWKGGKKPEIAEIVDMSLQGIYKVLNHYKENGVAGLSMGKAKGRERKMNAEQEAE